MNNKASSKYIYTIYGVHIGVFFNTESMNKGAIQFKRDNIYLVFACVDLD